MAAPRQIPVSAPADGLPPREIARLEAMRRLSMGAAHAMNNAFTAAIGEAQFLSDDRKDDAVIAEACQAILEQIERCTRITRALLTRRHPSQAGGGEVDLARLVRELGNLLAETLGRGAELEVVFPDDLLLVEGDAESLEIAVLTLVHCVADSVPGGAQLCLQAEGGDADVGIRLDFASADGGLDPAALRDPARIEDALLRSQIQAVWDVAAADGGRIEVREADGAGFSILLALPPVR